MPGRVTGGWCCLPTRTAGEARLAYQEALLLTENAPERNFLTDRLAALSR